MHNAGNVRNIKNVKRTKKRSNDPNRSRSKKSINSTRISLNTISSACNLGGTIDVSKENFNQMNINQRNEQLVVSNMKPQKTRNNSSLGQFNAQTVNWSNEGPKMTKCNTLTKLRPAYTSTEFTSKKFTNGYGEGFRQESIKANLFPYPGNHTTAHKNIDAMNCSWASQNNVDWSDIVLKGDVKTGLTRNDSVGASTSTLKVNESTINRQPIPAKNTRYGNNDSIGDFNNNEMMMCSQTQNLLSFKRTHSHGNGVEQDSTKLVERLQMEISQLKLKLQKYEDNCTWNQKVNTQTQSIQTEFSTQIQKMEGSNNVEVGNKFESKEALKFVKKNEALFTLSPDHYFGKKKQQLDSIEDISPVPVNNFKLDFTDDQEQQSSQIYPKDEIVKSPWLGRKESDTDSDEFKQTPLKKTQEKSPILSQDETDALFRSKGSHLEDKDEDDSDASYMKFRMVNPMDKSGFTPNSIGKSEKRSTIKGCTEDWTMDMPKILNYDRSECSSSMIDSP